MALCVGRQRRVYLPVKIQCKNSLNDQALCPSSLHSLVYLISDLWWRPCDGWGLPHPPPSENWYQSPWERWGLPGQSSCSLEPRNRHGACSQAGWHKFDVVTFSNRQIGKCLDRCSQIHTHTRRYKKKHIKHSQPNSWHEIGENVPEICAHICVFNVFLGNVMDHLQECTFTSRTTKTCFSVLMKKLQWFQFTSLSPFFTLAISHLSCSNSVHYSNLVIIIDSTIRC